MPITFSCPQCSRKMRTHDEYAGKSVKCPECASTIQVPGGETAEPNPTAGSDWRDRAQQTSPESNVAAPSAPRPQRTPPAINIPSETYVREPEHKEEFDEDEPQSPGLRRIRTDSSERYARQSSFTEMLTFRSFIAPILIQVVFWLGVLFAIGSFGLQCIGAINLLLDEQYQAGLLLFLFGISSTTAGLLLLRIVCETIILLFRMHEELCTISRRLSGLSRSENANE